jgi:hypothetical protein
MKSICLLLVFCILNYCLIANFDNDPVGARQAGMANSSVMMTDVWSVFHNQAGLAFVQRLTVASCFGNAFMIKELSTKSLAISLPTKSGTFGLGYTHFGYTLYNESKIGLAYSKQLWTNFSVGIQLDYFYTRIAEGYGSKGVPAGEIGILAQPVENLFIGAHVFNPVRAKMIEYDDERLPTIFRLGIGYLFSNKLLLTVESEKNLDKDMEMKAGIEFSLFKNLYLRTGISNNPVLNCFGIGFVFKNFKADLAFSKHPVLDYSTQFSLSYRFGQ